MGNYEQLKQAVSDVIKANGNQEITGAILQNALLTIISTVGANSTFAGIATPTTNPGTPDQNVFYIAARPGVYANFGYTLSGKQTAIFVNSNGTWKEYLLELAYSGDVNSNRVVLGFSPVIMYNKAYNTETGILNSFELLDCTMLIELPNTIIANTIEINTNYYEITCFDSDYNYLGAVHTPGLSLKSNTKYFSVSFLRSDNINYSLVKISGNFSILIPDDIRALKFMNGEISSISNVEFNVKTDNSIDVFVTNPLNLLTYDGSEKISMPKMDEAKNIPTYYSLLFDLDSKEYVVDTLVNLQSKNKILLAYVDNGKIVFGLFANIYNSQNDNDDKIKKLNIVSGLVQRPTIMYGKAYNSGSGVLSNFGLLDSTVLLEVSEGCEFVYLTQYKYYDIACFDKDMIFLGSIVNKYGNTIGLQFKSHFVGALLPSTRYFAVSFLKEDNIQYDNLYITANNVPEMNLCSNKGIKPPYIIDKHAFSDANGKYSGFERLDCTPIMPIPISANKPISFSFNVSHFTIACFDNEMNFITSLKDGNTAIPENTKYFSVSFLNDEEGYDKEIIRISINLANIDSIVLVEPKDGKKYYLFGDSITYWDSRISWYDPEVYMVAYPSYIRDILNVEIVNKGVAGNTSNAITTRLLATDLTDAYALTYMAGANDLHNSIPIGTIGEFDRETYIGNLETAVRYVLTNYPLCKMYFLSPLWETNGGAGGYEAYANAMQSVAEYYHVPILRWDIKSCIGEYTADTFYVHEGTTRLHPNNVGHRRLADSLIPFLQNY